MYFFVEKIVPVLCSSVLHCEILYEEWSVSQLYKLIENEMEELDYGIRYKNNGEFTSNCYGYWYFNYNFDNV